MCTSERDWAAVDDMRMDVTLTHARIAYTVERT